nr:hypothetical protein [Tanacetum cinerariifolium]
EKAPYLSPSYGNVQPYLCSPSVHVEAGQLLVAGQARIFALILWMRSGGLHVEAAVREALLIISLVGL